jgi:hypothetical protein
MLKSFRHFIGESEEPRNELDDLKYLFDMGMVDADQYLKKSLDQGIVPDGWREVEVSFEFDWTWADQTETDDATRLMKDYFAGFGSELPDGCWVDQDSIEVDEMGWGLEEDEEEDDDEEDGMDGYYREPAYHKSARGGMVMLVPDAISEDGLESWADGMTGRIFSEFFIED